MLYNMRCCGAQEYSGLRRLSVSSLREMMVFCKSAYEHRGCAYPAHIVFTDTVCSNRGEGLYNLIRKLNIGRVTRTGAKLNANSDNKVRVYVWSPNHVKLKKLNWKIKV